MAEVSIIAPYMAHLVEGDLVWLHSTVVPTVNYIIPGQGPLR